MRNSFINFTKKTLLALCLTLSISTLATAQTGSPTYYNLNGGFGNSSEPLNSNSSNKAQWIYAPNVFTTTGNLVGGTPAYLGLIDTIYFRIGNSGSPTFTDLSVRLSQNLGTQSNFPNAIFTLGMTQVYYAPSVQLVSSTGNWMYIVLQNPFLYDPSQSLIVEVEHNGFTTSNSGLNILEDNSGGNTKIEGTYGNTIGNSAVVGRANFGFDLVPATPCNSQTVTVGTLSPNNPIICAGQSLNLNAPNATLGSGYNFLWQISTNGGTTWAAAPGANTNLNYQTPAITATTMFRLIMTCTATSASDTSTTTVSVALPTYASLPYTQDFSNWVSYCGNQDVPNDYHWLNTPTSGNNAWRRNDEGPTASWNAPNGGAYPPFTSGNPSARFHSYFTTATGNLDLHLDCSGAGAKTLSFNYINDGSGGGTDNLTIEYRYPSLPSGFWLPAASFGSFGPAWTSQSVQINSTDPQTIVRFRAVGGTNLLPGSDIGIDNILVLQPCVGAPIAGTIDSTTACPGKDLNLSLTGTSPVGNLFFRWDTAATATGPWGFAGSANGPNFTLNNGINSSKYFRCRVSCGPNGPADTTVAIFVDVLPFYICYCDKAASTIFYENVGNVTLRELNANPPIINNGVATPTLSNTTSTNPYTLFNNPPYPIIYTDTSYSLDVSAITFDQTWSDCYMKVFIDYNRDGVYNFGTEVAIAGYVRASTNYQLIDTFTVPTVTNFGPTGMRVVLQQGAVPNSVLPCGPIGRGEVEDYVINLQRLPCNATPDAGLSQIDDTVTCAGNPVRIINNTHDRFFANLNFSWQESTDGVSFTDIPNGSVDTMTRTVNMDMWYRYRVTCDGGIPSFSNVVKVRVLTAPNCQASSAATGPNDKSDIGAVVISTPPPQNINLFTFSTGGPHLNNPASYKFYTNRTTAGNLPVYVDSQYKFSVYHVINTPVHTDAQVSIFIDYNNNQTFDLPNERVFNGSTTASSFFLTSFVNIPDNAVTNIPLLMRVVLNDDLSPNAASTTGYGPYVSGETEDYFLVLQDKPLSTGDIANIEQIGIYPNPTPGLVNVDFNAKQHTQVDIEVVNLLGSVLKTQHLGRISGQQHVTLDLEGFAKGVYLIRFTTDDAKFVRKITVK